MNRKLRPPLRPPWALLCCCVVLAAVVGIEWRQFGGATPAPEPPPQAAAAPVTTELASFVPPPVERFAEIAARPLFVPERRPQDDAEAAKAVPPPNAPVLTVQGVVLSAERRYAVIQHGIPPKLDALAEGATVEGWKIESIDTNRIALRAGAATVEVAVGKPNKGAAPRPAQAPANRRGGAFND